MATCFDVAQYFLSQIKPEDGDTITNLKLQKLVYYAQGYSLALLGCPLFEEEIRAWELGPVVPELWRIYKVFGRQAPLPEESEKDATANFTEEQLQILEIVYQDYGQYSAWKLSQMTHKEPTWKNTERDGVISKETMKSFFDGVISCIRLENEKEAERRLNDPNAKYISHEEFWAHVAA